MNTIVVTVFLLIMNQTENRLVHNQNENCQLEKDFPGADIEVFNMMD